MSTESFPYIADKRFVSCYVDPKEIAEPYLATGINENDFYWAGLTRCQPPKKEKEKIRLAKERIANVSKDDLQKHQYSDGEEAILTPAYESLETYLTDFKNSFVNDICNEFPNISDTIKDCEEEIEAKQKELVKLYFIKRIITGLTTPVNGEDFVSCEFITNILKHYRGEDSFRILDYCDKRHLPVVFYDKPVMRLCWDEEDISWFGEDSTDTLETIFTLVNKKIITFKVISEQFVAFNYKLHFWNGKYRQDIPSNLKENSVTCKIKLT